MAKRKQKAELEISPQDMPKKLRPGVRLVRTLRGHSGYIGRIAWSPDGLMLASPSADETIRLWDAANGNCLHQLGGHNSMVTCVAFDSTGRTLASGDDDGTIKLWDSVNVKLIVTFQAHWKRVNSVAFDPVGRT